MAATGAPREDWPRRPLTGELGPTHRTGHVLGLRQQETSSRQPSLVKQDLLCPLVHAVLGNEALGSQHTMLSTHRVRGRDGATLDIYLRSLEQQASSAAHGSRPRPHYLYFRAPPPAAQVARLVRCVQLASGFLANKSHTNPGEQAARRAADANAYGGAAGAVLRAARA